MAKTPNLALQYVVEGQEGIEDLINENLIRIDATEHLAWDNTTSGTNDPPTSPADGDTYIIGSTPTGVWSGHADEIAYWSDHLGSWIFLVPKEGWRGFEKSIDQMYEFDGTNWQTL